MSTNSLKTTGDISCDRCYGEVLITPRNTAALHCLLCPFEERSYQTFLQHIFGHHYKPSRSNDDEQVFEDESTLSKATVYGEVIITTRNTDMMRCLMCREEERSYQKFLAHIFAHHYEAAAERKAESVGLNNARCREEEEENASEEELVSECSESEAVERNKDANHSESSSHSVIDPIKTIQEMLTDRTKTEHELLEERTCPICKNVYKDKGIMRVHLKRHSGIKPFACKLCGSKFYTRVEVRLHLRSHSQERPFVCAFCGATFRGSERLHIHERKHRNERPFKCPHCEKAFYDNPRLKDHMLGHKDEKNVVCTVCKARFTRKKSLTQHMKLHANARQYKCNLCDEAFNQLPALSSHKKNRHKLVTLTTTQTSAEEGVKVCERCNVEFGTKAGLLVHYKQMHADEDATPSYDFLMELESEMQGSME